LAEAAEIPVPMLFELCSGGTAYEARPQIKTRIKLDVLLEAIRTYPSYEILAYTPYMLIVKTPKGAEVSTTRQGKLLIKRVENEEEARMATYDILRIGANAIMTRLPKS
jgi:hypothetical protein